VCCSTAVMSSTSCSSLLNPSVQGKEKVKQWKFKLDNFSLGPERRLTEWLKKEEWFSLWKRGTIQYSEWVREWLLMAFKNSVSVWGGGRRCGKQEDLNVLVR
jgi:hypothetical protein